MGGTTAAYGKELFPNHERLPAVENQGVDFSLGEVPPIAFAVGLGILLFACGVVLAVLLQLANEIFRGSDRMSDPHGLATLAWAVLPAAGPLAALALLRPIWSEALTALESAAFWALILLGWILTLYLAPKVLTVWHRDSWVPPKELVVAVAVAFAGFALIAEVAAGSSDTQLKSPGVSTLDVDTDTAARARGAVSNGPVASGGPGVSLAIEPWSDKIRVGETIPLGVKVRNLSGVKVSELRLEPPESSESILRGAAVQTIESLQNTSTWGPLLFEARLAKPGLQEVHFTLTYMNEGTKRREQVSRIWQGQVAGPRLEVRRYIYASPKVTSGQVVDVQLRLRNIGEVPIYALKLQPYLLDFFETPSGSSLSEILEPGEEFPTSYKARASSPGEGPLEKPAVSFVDRAGNHYDTAKAEGQLVVQNYYCTSPGQCTEGQRISVVPPDPGFTPFPIAFAPPVLDVDHSSKQAQFIPGEDKSHSLVVSHDGEHAANARVRVVDDGGLVLRGFEGTYLLASDSSHQIDGSVHVPRDTELGQRQPALEIQLLDQWEQPLGIPQTVQLSFHVTWVRLERIRASDVVTAGDEVRIETNVINHSEQTAEVVFEERFSGSGMNIHGEAQGPVGEGRGSHGNYYYVKFDLGPAMVEKRVIGAKADDPGQEFLEASVRYELADGTAGSASLSDRFTVRGRSN